MSDYQVVLGILNLLRDKGYFVSGPYQNDKHEGVIFGVRKPKGLRSGDKTDKFRIRIYLDNGEFSDVAVEPKAKQYLLHLCQTNGIYLEWLKKK
ncbi:hypothetical protein JIY74_31630 [Vibrio harveyi]|uniref:hypothetical protein n=1 Tax=Vibrio harveyi TaxID=669 RepID=UPI000B110998|nr:hypothetical protein [Vibrio harveyi]MBY7704737.1 hypothetical protein [Vibrio harveyi]UIL58987.1 hypothetical protein LXG94_12355 [Vibrio harveyi]SQA34678.1 Uncharacterised protein [Vibrio harveyi]